MRGTESNDFRFEATGPLFQALGVDLTLIEGIDVGTALVISARSAWTSVAFPPRNTSPVGFIVSTAG